MGHHRCRCGCRWCYRRRRWSCHLPLSSLASRKGPVMTTVEQAIATHYIAGLHYWTRLGTTADVICQNPLGAVEYSIHRETGGGILIIHSPSLIHGWADDILLGCPVQGGRC